MKIITWFKSKHKKTKQCNSNSSNKTYQILNDTNKSLWTTICLVNRCESNKSSSFVPSQIKRAHPDIRN